MSITKVSDVASSVIAQQPPVVVPANDAIDSSVKVLMTSEKGLLGRIVEFIRSIFGSVTPGSITDLRLSTHLVVKNVLSQLDFAASADAFCVSLSKRAGVLKLNLGQDKIALIASKLMKNVFAKQPVDDTVLDGVIKHVETNLNPIPAPVAAFSAGHFPVSLP